MLGFRQYSDTRVFISNVVLPYSSATMFLREDHDFGFAQGACVDGGIDCVPGLPLSEGASVPAKRGAGNRPGAISGAGALAHGAVVAGIEVGVAGCAIGLGITVVSGGGMRISAALRDEGLKDA